MNGRYGVLCPRCSRVVAYISESVAQRIAKQASVGFLPLSKVAEAATNGAALCCVECEAKRIEAEALAHVSHHED